MKSTNGVRQCEQLTKNRMLLADVSLATVMAVDRVKKRPGSLVETQKTIVRVPVG